MRVSKLGAPTVVLALLCAMYFLYFVDRVSISTVAPLIKADLKISNTQLGLAFSAFAIPYALFQLIGGWIGDRLGPRLTLAICCAIVGISTVLTGAISGIASLILLRLALGFGEGAGFPTATRAMASWTPQSKWGFAQGIVHSFARIGNAVTPPIMAGLLLFSAWRGSFVMLGGVSSAVAGRLGLVFSQRSAGASRDDRGGTGNASGSSQWRGAGDSLAAAGPANAAASPSWISVTAGRCGSS